MNKDSIKELKEYQQHALRTAPIPGQSIKVDADLVHGAIGVITEGGELLDAIKKHVYYGKPLDVVNLREEIGDVMWYLALLCRATNTDLSAVASTNIDKLRARFPDKFDPSKALNRNLDAEREILNRNRGNA
jgi:NTP pyrophosphatase (non-canonical NTP hydrolase)